MGPTGATFSYAQAAKGLSASVSTADPSSSPTLNPTSGIESKSANSSTAAGDNDKPQSLESETARAVNGVQEDLPNATTASRLPSSNSHKTSSPRLNGVSPPTSPGLGMSSASTTVKEDDQSSAVPTSTESTWDSKSQASIAAETPGDQADEGAEQAKSNEQSGAPDKDDPPAKPLYEAPPPVVNIWKKRAEARAAVVPAPPKARAPSSGDASSNGVNERSGSNKNQSPAEPGHTERSRNLTVKERKSDAANVRHQSEPRVGHNRREARPDDESAKGRRNQNARTASHEAKSTSNVPLPPARDQEAWPTPEIATEEDKKKSTEKTDKVDKQEQADDEASDKRKAHGKNAWVSVPFTPTVVFNTPLPGSSRRGGKGGGRSGGREESSRANYSNTTSGSPPVGDKKHGPSSVNGDHPRRGRAETSTRSASPAKKIPESAARSPSAITRQKSGNAEEAQPRNFDSGSADAPSLPNGHHRKFSVDRISNAGLGRGSGTRGRGRRGDYGVNATERRREAENGVNSTDSQPASSRVSEAATPGSQEPGNDREKSSTNDSQPFSKQPPFERRTGQFATYPNPRDRNEPRGRGSMRGRGGHHYQSSQHLPNQHQVHGSSPMLPQQMNYAPSRSPPSWQQDQPGPFMPPPQSQHPRHFRGSNPRSQSIPTEPGYGQFGNVYGAMPPHMSPLQTFMGNIYDPQQAAQPISAIPYTPYAEQYGLFSMVAMQLEYYFSVDNLIKDIYLRKHMDSKGFVFLSFIAAFKRMKQLTTDLDLIKYACADSKTIEWRVGPDGKDRLRPVSNWQQWVLAPEERDPSARHNGPDELSIPNPPVPQGFEPPHLQTRHSLAGAMPQSALAATAPWSQANGTRLPYSAMSPEPHHSPHFPQGQPVMANGYDPTQMYMQGHPPMAGPSPPVDPEADNFSDVQAAKLTVIVGRSTNADQPVTNGPSALPNGSADHKESEGDRKSKSQGSGGLVNGSDVSKGRPEKQDTGASSTAATESSVVVDNARLCWIKNNDQPVEILPSEAERERYPDLRAKALQERKDASEGVCPHNLIVLYGFWSHFLLRNFNTNMYNEFRQLALEDRQQRKNDSGFQHLLKFYKEALSTSDRPIRDRIAHHYVELANTERENASEQGEAAFKQLRAQWRDGATDMRNRKKISVFIDDELKSALEA